MFFLNYCLFLFFIDNIDNPGSGSKLDQNSESGSKFRVFGSTKLFKTGVTFVEAGWVSAEAATAVDAGWCLAALTEAGSGCETGGSWAPPLVALALTAGTAGVGAVVASPGATAAVSLVLTWFWSLLLVPLLLVAALAAAFADGGCLAALVAAFCCLEPGGQRGETVGSGMGRVGGMAVRDRPEEIEKQSL